MYRTKVIFRADGSSEIGMGHFVRSLALAEMLIGHHYTIFATRTPTEYQIKEVGRVCNELWALCDDHFDEFIGKLNGDEIVVLDNYFYDTDYQRKIRSKGCRLICIDDMHNKHYVADVVINHSPNLSRSDFDVEMYTQIYTGYAWSLLRKPFIDKPLVTRLLKNDNLNVVVSFGGADRENLAGRVVDILLKCREVREINVLIGDSYKPKTLIEDNRIKYHKNISASQVAELFEANDVAILSASTVSIEALACNIPIIAGYWVDNQKEGYHSMIKFGLCQGVGNLLESNNLDLIPKLLRTATAANISFEGITQRYLFLFQNESNLNFISNNLKFINYINLDREQNVVVHAARNHPDIRRWMKNTDSFSFESHMNFVERLKEDKTQLHWAVFQNDIYVGSMNLNPFDESTMEAEVGNFVAPSQLESGIGLEMIYWFNDFIFKNLGIRKAKGVIKNSNKGVITLGKKLGAETVSKDNQYTYTVNTPNYWNQVPFPFSNFVKSLYKK